MLRPSIVAAGLDPDNIPPSARGKIDFDDPHKGAKAWRDIWSAGQGVGAIGRVRSEEHTSELQSLMRSSYDVFCLINKTDEMDRQSTSHKTYTAKRHRYA